MAQIRYSCGDLHRYCPEPSAEPVTASSVKEQILQQCLRRFYEKNSSIDHYTGNRSQFIVSSKLNNDESGEKLSGLISCEAFKKKLRSSEVRQILESADLSREEISLLLEICNSSSANSDSVQVLHEESCVNLTLLSSLLEKLSRNNLREQDSKPQQFKDVLVFESRRDFEAAVRDGVVDRELHCQQRTAGQSFTGDAFVRVVSKKRPAVHPDHPLNHLAEIDLQLFNKKKKSCHQQEKESDESTTDLDGTQNEILMHQSESDPNEKCLQAASDSAPCVRDTRAKSKWDVKESDCTTPLQKPNSEQFGKPGEEKRKDFSREFVLLPKDDDLLPIPLIKEHCISLDELLKEFPQYSRGIPSKTLYLKNLQRRVTPNDLMSLFGHFDNGLERVTYRLLSGRMRGQAFIKFPNVSAAEAALETCLGFKLKGKPLVIQFGKRN